MYLSLSMCICIALYHSRTALRKKTRFEPRDSQGDLYQLYGVTQLLHLHWKPEPQPILVAVPCNKKSELVSMYVYMHIYICIYIYIFIYIYIYYMKKEETTRQPIELVSLVPSEKPIGLLGGQGCDSPGIKPASNYTDIGSWMGFWMGSITNIYIYNYIYVHIWACLSMLGKHKQQMV